MPIPCRTTFPAGEKTPTQHLGSLVTEEKKPKIMPDIIEFDQPKISPSIIMVAGVGGGGSNAVNYMYELGIADVSFMVCNTDRQALYRSPVPIKVRLGESLTQGLGAGNNPERGREAALESLDEIVEIFKREGTKMVFITAGMGGGTGTGAAPVIAKAARELGILTVAIVTLPFKTEGPKRMTHAYEGIEQLRQYVDSLLLINNENIQDIYGKLTLSEAFGKADDILATAAKSIAEVITRDNTVNVDFADVQTVMRDSGIALMGSGRASGEDRAMEVANAALTSPLLNHNDIVGAKNILINITSGEEEITLEETYLITEYIQERSGNNADIIWGAGTDPSLGSDIEVTIIATGFAVESIAQNYTPFASPLQARLDAARQAAETEAGSEEETAPEPETKPEEETPAAPARPRWTPPQERQTPPRPTFNRPLSPRPLSDPRTAAPTPSPVIPPAPNTQSAPSPLGRPAAAPQVIESKDKNQPSAFDIDEMENVPAFVRRKMRFVKDNPEEGGRSSRVVLKDDASQDDKPQGGNSLFD